MGVPDDGDERAAGTHQCGGAIENLSTDRIEDHVDFTDVIELVGLEVQKGVRSQAEDGVAVGGPAGADHDGSHLAGELHGDRSDTASGTVY